MVSYSEQSLTDLEDIFDGLVNWSTNNGQRHLDYESVVNYFNDIVDICDALDRLCFHFKTIYKTHQQYGTCVHAYNRNKNTTWYIIYDKEGDDVFIRKLMNNYFTI